jgi:YVTN family beta-propeller protein
MKKYVLLMSFVLLATLLAPASWATVFCTLNTGGEPVDALHDAVNNRTFVSLFTGNEILVLGHGCSIESVLSTSTNPGGMAFDGTNLWVALYGANAVEKINVSTGNGTIYRVGDGPRSVAFDGTYIWVTNENSNTVTKLLASNGFIENTITVGSHPWGVAVNDTNAQLTIWVANLSSSSISVLNQNGVLQQTIATGSEPLFFASSTTYYGTLYGGNMFVSCYTSERVEEFSSGGSLVASYAIAGSPTGISQGPSLYGAAHDGVLFLISPGGSVTYENVGYNNYGTAYDLNSSTVWVTDINEGKIFEIVP